MEYTVSKLAQISGVSARTLRYYDEIDLLKPKRINSNGYRIYGSEEVDLLQQILFYREMELSLKQIKKIIYANNFNIEFALKNHLHYLTQEKRRLNNLIQMVEKSLQTMRGEAKMEDQEKFEAFKKELIDENEAKYGAEIREKYGEETIAEANNRINKWTAREYQDFEQLTTELNEKLAEAVSTEDPESELGQEAAKLHQQWLTKTWPEDYYDKQKHYNLSLMYIEDERFKTYYEKIAPGAAEFLHEALSIYLDI